MTIIRSGLAAFIEKIAYKLYKFSVHHVRPRRREIAWTGQMRTSQKWYIR